MQKAVRRKGNYAVDTGCSSGISSLADTVKCLIRLRAGAGATQRVHVSGFH